MPLAISTWTSRWILRLKNAQVERAVGDVDMHFQQNETARAFVALQQARRCSKLTSKTTANVDAALVGLGVLQPHADPQRQCEFNCGFSTEDQTELAKHHTHRPRI